MVFILLGNLENDVISFLLCVFVHVVTDNKIKDNSKIQNISFNMTTTRPQLGSNQDKLDLKRVLVRPILD